MQHPGPAARLLAPSSFSTFALRPCSRAVRRPVAATGLVAGRRDLQLPSLRWQSDERRGGHSNDTESGQPEATAEEHDAVRESAEHGRAKTLGGLPRPRPIKRVRGKARRPRDIVPGDLEGTLEAHRAANRAAIIRKVNVPNPGVADHEIPEWAKAPRQDPWQIPPKQETQDNKSSRQPSDDALDTLIRRLSTKSTPSEKDIDHVIKAIHDTHVGRGQSLVRSATKAEAKITDLRRNWEAADWNVPFRPWRRSLAADEPSSNDQRFEQDLRQFDAWMQPTHSERAAAEELYTCARHIISKTVPNAKIELHGSRSTGMADALSDIDFAVILDIFDTGSLGRGPGLSHPDAKKTAHLALLKLERAFRRNHRFSNVFYVSETKVPVLGAVDRLTGLSVQVAVNSPFVAVREMTRYWSRRLPFARPIYLLFRQALIIRGLGKSQSGGIGGYCLYMLIITALSHAKAAPTTLKDAYAIVQKFVSDPEILEKAHVVDPPVSVDKRSTREVSRLRLDGPDELVPYLAGLEFLIRQNTSRLQGGLQAMKRTRNVPMFVAQRLMLQDPANPYNDLGAKASRIPAVLALLAKLHDATIALQDESCDGIGGDPDTLYETFLDAYLEAGWGWFLARRQRVRLVDYPDLALLSTHLDVSCSSTFNDPRSAGIFSELSADDDWVVPASISSSEASHIMADTANKLDTHVVSINEDTDCTGTMGDESIESQWHDILGTRAHPPGSKSPFWYPESKALDDSLLAEHFVTKEAKARAAAGA